MIHCGLFTCTIIIIIINIIIKGFVLVWYDWKYEFLHMQTLLNSFNHFTFQT